MNQLRTRHDPHTSIMRRVSLIYPGVYRVKKWHSNLPFNFHTEPASAYCSHWTIWPSSKSLRTGVRTGCLMFHLPHKRFTGLILTLTSYLTVMFGARPPQPPIYHTEEICWISKWQDLYKAVFPQSIWWREVYATFWVRSYQWQG